MIVICTIVKILITTENIDIIDSSFMKTANTDFEVQNQSLKTEVASVTTREIIDMTDSVDNVFMPVTNVPDEYRIDSKPWTNRPFYVGRLKFKTTDARYSVLATPIKWLPGDIARSNPALLNMFKIGALGRPDLVLNPSISGTIGHAGCVLAAVLPPLPTYPTDARYYINTALSGPHAFLNANEATSAVLPVPWFCNTDMMTLDMDGTAGYDTSIDLNTQNGNYGTLVFIVINPLTVSSGSTNEVNIIIEACFRNFDMVVPTPRYINWVAQVGQLSALNPTYDRYEALLAEIAATLPSEEEAKKESRAQRMIRRLRLLALVGSLTSLTATLVSHLSTLDCVNADIVDMVPQAGILATLGSAIVPGLIGNAVSLGKKVTGDLLDRAGSAFRQWTGLHNANEAIINERIINTDVNFANVVDTKQYFEKLDPHANSNRIVTEPIFGTTTDEMDVTHITSKDQFLGSFSVASTDDMGKRLWNKPISPFQGGLGVTPIALLCVNNLELLHSMHRGWRGGLKLKIQSVMNNKQQVKLKVIKYYNPSVKALSQYPEYTSIVNAPSHLLEFTQGGQMLEIDLPFLCRNAIVPRGENPDMEAMMHGMYYIYLAQPLVTSDGSPSSVEFNVYMCGADDLQFYGYVTSNTYHSSFNYNPSISAAVDTTDFTTLDASDMFMFKTDDLAMAKHSARIIRRLTKTYNLDRGYLTTSNNVLVKNGVVVGIRSTKNMPKTTKRAQDDEEPTIFDFGKMNKDLTQIMSDNFKEQSAPLTVMNEPQKQKVDLNNQRSNPPVEITRLMPTINLRDIIRRMYKSEVLNFEVQPSDYTVRVYPLAKYVSELPNNWAYTPLSLISRSYYGKSVGFKIRIVVNLQTNDVDTPSPESLGVRIYYQPQGVNINSTTKAIYKAGVNSNAYGTPLSSSLYGEPPFTYQVTPVQRTGNTIIYEFVVPDTSYYKFLGSPEKFKDFLSATPTTPLSTNDFGSLVLIFTNYARQHPFSVYAETFVGLTDESRLGFHCIAPPFQLSKSLAFYTGTNTNATASIPDTLNPFVYKGGLLP
nr:MAG: capsid protein [flactilig virus 9]